MYFKYQCNIKLAFLVIFTQPIFGQQKPFFVDGIWNQDGSSINSEFLLDSIDMLADMNLYNLYENIYKNIRVVYDQDCKLDSVFYTESPKDWSPKKCFRKYDFSEDKIYIHENKFADNGLIELSDKTFDSKNRLTHHSWSRSSTSTSSGTEYYTYDSLDNVIKIQKLESQRGSTGEWSTQVLEDFLYDSMNRLIRRRFSTSTIDNVVDNSARKTWDTIIYQGTKIINEKSIRIQSSEFSQSDTSIYETEYKYLADNQIEKIQTKNLELFSKSTCNLRFENVLDGNESISEYRWSQFENEWQKRKIITSSYDKYGNLDMYIESDSTRDGWKVITAYTYKYDERGNQLEQTNYKDCDGNLKPYWRKIKTYYENNVPSSETQERYNCNARSWYLDKYYEFIYNYEEKLLISKEVYFEGIDYYSQAPTPYTLTNNFFYSSSYN